VTGTPHPRHATRGCACVANHWRSLAPGGDAHAPGIYLMTEACASPPGAQGDFPVQGGVPAQVEF